VLPLFTAHLGGGHFDIGLVASVSAFVGIVASLPAGIFSDIIGRKKMLIVSALIFSTAPFLYLFVTTIWQLMLVRFYHGFATAIFVPIAMAYVSELFDKARGEKLGWFSTSTLIGRFIAPTVGGVIISLLVFSPPLSLKAVYIVCAIAGIITFVLAWRIPNPVTPHKKNPQDKIDGEEIWKFFKKVISHKPILITSLIEACMLFSYGTFETFLPLFLVEKGHSAYEIGIFFSAQIITLAMTKPFMGKFSDKHGRKPQIIAGTFLGAVCLGALPLCEGFLFLLIISILFGLSLSIVTSATSAYIADLSKKELYGSSMGLLGTIMDMGHTTGPLISGIVAHQLSVEISFLAASAVVAFTGIFFMILLGMKEERINK
jgi:MFS family permease